MYFLTNKPQTTACIWNTAIGLDIENGVLLSDFTELRSEFEPEILQETLERVIHENADHTMRDPLLMTVTTGNSKSCRVWIDRQQLTPRPDIEDLQKDSDFYSDQ